MTGWHQTGIAGRSKLLYLLMILSFKPGVLAVYISTENRVISSIHKTSTMLPCNYTLQHPGSPLNIRWEFDDNIVLERDSLGEVHPGSGYEERVALGEGCSLILINPSMNDTGKYTVDIIAYKDKLWVDTANCVLKIYKDEQKSTTESVALVYPSSTAMDTTVHPPEDQSLMYQRTISCGILVFAVWDVIVCLLFTAKLRSRKGQAMLRQHDFRNLYILLSIGYMNLLFSLTVGVYGIVTPKPLSFIWIKASGFTANIGAVVLLVFWWCTDPSLKDR